MTTANFENIITSSVESLQKIRPQDKNAILFHFALDSRFYSNAIQDSVGFHTEFELIITVTSNYKKVFYRDYIRDNENNYKEWIFTSDHDSCWKSDGLKFLFNNWIHHRNSILEKLEKLNIYPKNIHEINSGVNFSPSIFHPFFKFVQIEWQNDPNDNRKIITSIEE